MRSGKEFYETHELYSVHGGSSLSGNDSVSAGRVFQKNPDPT